MRPLHERNIPVSGLKTPFGILYQPLPIRLQILMFLWVFLGAPFYGKVVGDLIDGLSASGRFFLYFPYSISFIGGYLFWMARLKRLTLKKLYFTSFQKQHNECKEEKEPCEDELVKLTVIIQKKGFSFATVSWPFGGMIGAISTLFYSSQGPRSQFIIVSSTLIIWGYFSAFLARRGYLPVLEKRQHLK